MQIDKRIIKTRTNIKTAFMELVQTREMSKISISELASTALVNRSTFYLHYGDVSEVAQDIESEIKEKISSLIDDFTITDIYGSTYTLFKKLTARLDENDLMRRYIIFSTNSAYIIERIKEIFVEKTKNSIINKFPSISESSLLYPLTFAAAGIVDSYVKWVREESTIPLEEMIREVVKITEYIIETVTTY